MLSGTAHHEPAELRLRPLDVSSLTTVRRRQARLAAACAPISSAVLGQSWGATTGAAARRRPAQRHLLEERSRIVQDRGRTSSWVLQCSFISSAQRAPRWPIPRVKAGGGVSPTDCRCCSTTALPWQ